MRGQKTSILTNRDTEILSTLTKRVRVLSELQIAQRWWTSSTHACSSARRSLKRLIDARLLATGVGMAHPLISLESPVVAWTPGSPVPDAEQTAYRLQSRWSLAPVSTRWFSATRRAGSLTGGFGGRTPRASDLAHDIHLAQLYMRLEGKQPRVAATWTSETELYTLGMGRNKRLPDAMVREDDSWRVIEFGGAYSSDKVRAFHDFCSDCGLGYEIW